MGGAVPLNIVTPNMPDFPVGQHSSLETENMIVAFTEKMQYKRIVQGLGIVAWQIKPQVTTCDTNIPHQCASLSSTCSASDPAPTKAPSKAMGDGPNGWNPGIPDGVPGSRLSPDPIPVTATIWEMKQMEDLFPFLCLSPVLHCSSENRSNTG